MNLTPVELLTGVIAVGSSAVLGLMVISLMGYFPHSLQTVRQAPLAIGVRCNFLPRFWVNIGASNYLKILILSPLITEPSFGGLANMNQNIAQDRLNLRYAIFPNLLQCQDASINYIQSELESGGQEILPVNYSVSPFTDDKIKTRQGGFARSFGSNISSNPRNEKPSDQNNNAASQKNVCLTHIEIPIWFLFLLLFLSSGCVRLIYDARMRPNDQKLSHGGTEPPPANAELTTLTAVGSSAVLARMVEISNKWKQSGIYAFASAEKEPDEMGKKLIQHGAMIYHNCWSDLQEIVAALRASTTPSKSETSKKHQA